MNIPDTSIQSSSSHAGNNTIDNKTNLRNKLHEKIRYKSGLRRPKEQQLKQSSNLMNQFKESIGDMSNDELINVMTDEYMKEHNKSHPGSIDPSNRNYYKKEIKKLLEKK